MAPIAEKEGESLPRAFFASIRPTWETRHYRPCTRPLDGYAEVFAASSCLVFRTAAAWCCRYAGVSIVSGGLNVVSAGL